MEAKDYWQLFLDTGAPEMYLLYNKAKKVEDPHVFSNPWTGTASGSLQ